MKVKNFQVGIAIRVLDRITLAVFTTIGSAAAVGAESPVAPPTETIDSILSRINAPEFPNRDFVITDYGASPHTDCTEAIRKAITACHDAGGGRVVVPAGAFLTGAVHLKIKVNLHLADGATLKFDPEPAKYLPVVPTRFERVECMNYSPLIYSFGQDNVAVTGKGTLDGSATTKTWLKWNASRPAIQTPARNRLFQTGEDNLPVEQRVFGDTSYLRPNFIQIYKGKNVLIEGVTITSSPMWEIHPVLCTNVTVRDVTVRSLGRNNDGCDPESCRGVLIEDCTFVTGEDCIAIKSGRNNDGQRIGVPSENFIIRRCTMKDGYGGLTIGREISGGCRHVFVQQIKIDSTKLNQAVRFKSNAQRGGVIENVHIRDVEIGRVGISAMSIEFDYEEGARGPHKPVLRNMTIENVTAQSYGQVLNIGSFPGAVIENISLKNCTFRGVKSSDRIRGAQKPTMENVVVEPANKSK
jgi:unsaturated rhamnogalacturonyl hydrolase